jgi:hypothetical protein
MKIQLHCCAAVVAGLALLGACNQKSEENCSKAQGVIRQALAAKTFEGLNQWREYAYQHCEDKAMLAQLDQEIVTQQNQVAAAKAAAQQAEQQKQQLLTLFQQWVASARPVPERSVQGPLCEGDEKSEAAKKKERFCNGSRQLTGMPGAAFMLRYWEKEPVESARYSVRMATPTQCNALGPNRVLKIVPAPATNGTTVNRYYCEFTGGPLSGRQGLASDANNADLYVFGAKYLEHDAPFANIVN